MIKGSEHIQHYAPLPSPKTLDEIRELQADIIYAKREKLDDDKIYCTKCFQPKPLSEFRTVITMIKLKDGSYRKYSARRTYCKDCHNKQCYRAYKKRNGHE